MTLMVALVLPLAAQDFELQAPGATFPVGLGAAGDPEGISTNGVAGSPPPIVATDWPCSGSRNLAVYSGGFEPNPAAGVPPTVLTNSPEVYIPVPAGLCVVSFCWNGWSGDPIGNANYNDGIMIDVVDASNTQLAVLVYRDAFSDTFTGVFSEPIAGFGLRPEFSPAGLKSVSDAPLPAGAAYIRVAAFSGQDASVRSAVTADDFVFGLTGAANLVPTRVSAARIVGGVVTDQSPDFDVFCNSPATGEYRLELGTPGGPALKHANGILIPELNELDSGFVNIGGDLFGWSANGGCRMRTSTASGADAEKTAAFAYFPFAENWQGAFVGSGAGLGVSTLPVGTTATRTSGRFVLDIPGVDSQADGMLFTAVRQVELLGTTSGHATAAGTAPTPDGGWYVTEYTDDGFVAAPISWSAVYLPYDTPGLIGGRVDAAGNVVSSSGSFYVTRTGTGTYEIGGAGMTDSGGVLLLQSFELAPSGDQADNKEINYAYDSSVGAFRVQVRGVYSATVAPLEDGEFVFAFISFTDPPSNTIRRPGSNEDLRLQSGVGAGLATGDLHTANAGDLIHLRLTSPGRTFESSIDFLLGQLVPTGSPPLCQPQFGLPELHLDPFAMPVFLDPGHYLFGPTPLGATGTWSLLSVPASLTGSSLLVQGFVLDSLAANGGFAASHAHEIVFN